MWNTGMLKVPELLRENFESLLYFFGKRDLKINEYYHLRLGDNGAGGEFLYSHWGFIKRENNQKIVEISFSEENISWEGKRKIYLKEGNFLKTPHYKYNNFWGEYRVYNILERLLNETEGK